jgi:hypothetical protein
MDQTTKPKAPGKWKQQKQDASVVRGSEGARRAASAILEVVSGERGAYEAAEALGISPMRYYALEGRALQGMVTALEPRPRGPRGPRPEDVLRKAEAEKDRLVREVGRLQSLLRLVRKGYRLEEPKAAAKGKGKGKRRPKPKTRARELVARLRKTEPISSGETASSTTPTDEGGET